MLTDYSIENPAARPQLAAFSQTAQIILASVYLSSIGVS
jgi:hypothetical protein